MAIALDGTDMDYFHHCGKFCWDSSALHCDLGLIRKSSFLLGRCSLCGVCVGMHLSLSKPGINLPSRVTQQLRMPDFSINIKVMESLSWARRFERKWVKKESAWNTDNRTSSENFYGGRWFRFEDLSATCGSWGFTQWYMKSTYKMKNFSLSGINMN